MANPTMYTTDALGVRTVQPKGDIADVIVRIDIEDLQLLGRFPRNATSDTHPQILEDNMQAIDLTNFHAQFSPAPAAASTGRTINENEVQVLKKTATVSNVQNAINQYGMGKEFDYQKALRLREIMRDGEAFLLSDQVMQQATAANAWVGRMAGLSTLITTNTNLVAAFNQANLNTLVLNAVTVSGGNPLNVWLDGTRKVAAAAWVANVTRFTNDTKTMYTEVQKYNAPIGFDMTFHLHKHMPQNLVGNAAVCLGLDLRPNVWQLKQLIPLKTEDIAYTGAGPASQIMWALTVLCGAEQANFAFVG